MVYSKVDYCEELNLDIDFLSRLDWQDLDDNPSISRAEILNEDIKSHLGGLRRFEFDGVFYSVELIDSYSSYVVAY